MLVNSLQGTRHPLLQRVVQFKVVMVLSWKNLDFKIQTGWFKPVFKFLK